MGLFKLFLISIIIFFPFNLKSASWDHLKTKRFGNWVSYYNQYNSGKNNGRKFCTSLVSNRDGTSFSLHFFPDGAVPFLEVINKNWKLGEGNAKITLMFRGSDCEWCNKGVANLPAQLWGNALTFDLVYENDQISMLSYLGENETVEILLDSNKASLGIFTLTGARFAVTDMLSCLKNKN